MALPFNPEAPVFTEDGEKLVRHIAEQVSVARHKAADPAAFLAAWDQLFREGIAALAAGGTR